MRIHGANGQPTITWCPKMDAKTACVFINGLLFISPNGFVAVVSAAERPTIKKDTHLGNDLTVPISSADALRRRRAHILKERCKNSLEDARSRREFAGRMRAAPFATSGSAFA